MPVNRTSKPLSRMPRRDCAPWKPVDRRQDRALGIPVITIRGNRDALLERARLLVRDPGYPPPYVVKAVADLIARHVQI
jgi:hypothetical protein